ncbi:protein FAR1-RELATED SEQUENCE 5-like [Oryza brachyantha]|uniref:protein FAR1-RELATED SEQUENCE 5-like n=1 Tax=Oryza brachyantha TaxID=4533 RepID=UPI001ADC60BB|nr:protein FAR1-RELATED SEQUENCE 5-like [Oryza brachyantha]
MEGQSRAEAEGRKEREEGLGLRLGLASAGAPVVAGEPPSVGMEFPTSEAAREFYCAYADRAGFAVRTDKSRRSRRDDSVIMRRFVCTREGFHPTRQHDDLTDAEAAAAGKRRRKRLVIREGCMAMCEVTKKEPPLRWAVTKFVAHHVHPVSLQVSSRRPPTGPSDALAGALGESTRAAAEPSDEPTGAPAAVGNGAALFCNRLVRANPAGVRAEVQDVLDYLRKMQAESTGFFYAMQVDSGNCVTNVFWADAKARMAYKSFGDAVTFDTTYRKTKYMMPFAVFRGINHHLQGITFGCCLLMDETKGSYAWLFDTWLAAMGGRQPDLLVTDQGKAMEAGIARVLPNTRHCFCQRNILSLCKQKLSVLYTQHINLKADLKECVFGAETTEEFQARWDYVIDKYSLQENVWLQSLYDSRQQWAWVYQKGSFFPELLKSQRSDRLNKFFKTNFNMKTPLLVLISRFDQVMSLSFEKEAQANSVTAYSKPTLKTPSVIERQAANTYTRAVFDLFQEEFIESLGYHADKIEDGVILKHVLRIFFMVGVRTLPEGYILKRWTMDAVTSVVPDERSLEPAGSFPERLVAWHNDLSLDANE